MGFREPIVVHQGMVLGCTEDARQLALALDVEPYDQRKPDPEEGSMEEITEFWLRAWRRSDAESRRRGIR